VNQLKISSSQQADFPQPPTLTQSSPFPQQYEQPPPTTISPNPPPFAPPFAPDIGPQFVGPMVPPTGPPYGYHLAGPYGSPSAPPVGPTHASPTNQGYTSQNYPTPVPFHGHQQPPPPPHAPIWLPSSQGQQQGYPNFPAFPGQYDSPNQPPPPTYQQLFGHSRAEQVPKMLIQNVPDVEVMPAKAPKEFKVGMKVEAVDRRFPYFVCVATIAATREKNHEVLIHFDGWSNAYDYWCEPDAIELHPVGWCETYGWELQKPTGMCLIHIICDPVLYVSNYIMK